MIRRALSFLAVVLFVASLSGCAALGSYESREKVCATAAQICAVSDRLCKALSPEEELRVRQRIDSLAVVLKIQATGK